MYIIIKDRSNPIRSLKGRSITEFASNLESNGWPSEFANPEAKDRAKFIERREGRPLRKTDLRRISREMGT